MNQLARWWRRARARYSRRIGTTGHRLMAIDNGFNPPATGVLVRAGQQVDLRRHMPGDRETFARWYQDPEIAELLRHDLSPLSANQARNYFDSIIMPATQRGTCWAIHEHRTSRLIGSTALVDINDVRRSSLFRIVIGEKDSWGQGYGTEATDLVLAEAFMRHGLDRVHLEVFEHNPRARGAYARVGFQETGQHVEWVARASRQIDVIEMVMTRQAWLVRVSGEP